ncbi:PhoPQ-activated pathogenicity-related family protein [Bremerella sp. P1]|uniref:PhoPQ-activated pathogenicity-related family protein n=1 Tax=Bremerella sp. P1 TaxID=3026424 RepID=UPI0023676459|nr:PhoPQ-activated protein PqaA family protein [Bremerella sp. P1]WDI44074.1 PhoPQ-activated protein PqaA family protein [Bremerella sp. P1]
MTSLRLLPIIAALLLVTPALSIATAQEPAQALAAYVQKPDDSFAWKVRHQEKIGTCDVTELTLTSQTWKDIVWKHRLFVIMPAGVPEETDAVLVVAGGSWKDQYEQPPADGKLGLPKEASLLSIYAQQIGCPIAVLLNVPQQPIFDGKKEDAIIALTFLKYLETGESDWPLLLPMVKSATKAMDAVQAYASEQLNTKIDGFTVTGASKRGWTTWLVSAIDPRVHGLAPMVIDTLKMDAQLKHQQKSYGTLSQRIDEYTDLKLPQRLETEEGQNLRRIVDPYHYLPQIKQPKLIFLGTNDSFWTVDSLNLYWDEVEGDKYIVYVPNADHDLAKDWIRVFGGLRALRRHVDEQKPMPNLKWDYIAAGGDIPLKLTVSPGEKAAVVHLWTAQSATRDFRQAKWTSQILPRDQYGTATTKLNPPAEGYQASFAEVVYAHDKVPFYLSTTMRVLGAED